MKYIETVYTHYILKKFEYEVTKDYRMSENLYKMYKGKNDKIFIEEELLQHFLGVSRCLKKIKDTYNEVETLHDQIGDVAFEKHIHEEIEKFDLQTYGEPPEEFCLFGEGYEHESI